MVTIAYMALEELTAIFFYVYIHFCMKKLHQIHYGCRFEMKKKHSNQIYIYKKIQWYENNVKKFCDGM